MQIAVTTPYLALRGALKEQWLGPVEGPYQLGTEGGHRLARKCIAGLPEFIDCFGEQPP